MGMQEMSKWVGRERGPRVDWADLILRRFMIAVLLAAFCILGAAALHAQGTPAAAVAPVTPAWSFIASESATLSATLPAGATYRLGSAANNCWSPSVTVASATMLTPISMSGTSQFPFSDPCPGVVKEFDVQQAAAAQLVVLSDTTQTPATWATLVPPLGGPPAMTAGNHAVVLTSFQNTATTVNALMLALVNDPSGGGAQAWEGTQFQLSIDGAVMLCTYGQTYVDGVFTLSCVVPATAQ